MKWLCMKMTAHTKNNTPFTFTLSSGQIPITAPPLPGNLQQEPCCRQIYRQTDRQTDRWMEEKGRRQTDGWKRKEGVRQECKKRGGEEKKREKRGKINK